MHRPPDLLNVTKTKLQLGTTVPCQPAGEDSYSHHVDMDVGLAVIDRFTYYLLNFFEGIRVGSRATMAQLFDSIRSVTALCICPYCTLLSTCVKMCVSKWASMLPLWMNLAGVCCFACFANGKGPSAVPVAYMIGLSMSGPAK